MRARRVVITLFLSTAAMSCLATEEDGPADEVTQADAGAQPDEGMDAPREDANACVPPVAADCPDGTFGEQGICAPSRPQPPNLTPPGGCSMFISIFISMLKASERAPASRCR